MDHRTLIRYVQFTHVYNQATCMCTSVNVCTQKHAHECDMHDTHVALNMWMTCTVSQLEWILATYEQVILCLSVNNIISIYIMICSLQQNECNWIVILFVYKELLNA